MGQGYRTVPSINLKRPDAGRPDQDCRCVRISLPCFYPLHCIRKKEFVNPGQVDRAAVQDLAAETSVLPNRSPAYHGGGTSRRLQHMPPANTSTPRQCGGDCGRRRREDTQCTGGHMLVAGAGGATPQPTYEAHLQIGPKTFFSFFGCLSRPASLFENYRRDWTYQPSAGSAADRQAERRVLCSGGNRHGSRCQDPLCARLTRERRPCRL